MEIPDQVGNDGRFLPDGGKNGLLCPREAKKTCVGGKNGLLRPRERGNGAKKIPDQVGNDVGDPGMT